MSDPVSPAEKVITVTSTTTVVGSVSPLEEKVDSIKSSIEAVRAKVFSTLKNLDKCEKRLLTVRGRSMKEEGQSGREENPESSVLALQVKEPCPFERLKQLGFDHLARKLRDKRGPLWDRAFKLEFPLLLEQLYEFDELLIAKETSQLKFDKEGLFSFALKIAVEKRESALPILGKLLFVLNEYPGDTSSLFSSREASVFSHCVEETFKKRVDELKSDLAIFFENHQQAGIQQAEIARKNRLPVELSKLLITDTGSVNIGLIRPLIDCFVEHPDRPMNYEINLLCTLKGLLAFPELREQLAQISKPAFPQDPANTVIRATLNLPQAHLCTDLDAKKTALAALLSHMRQGQDGSCFATPLTVELLINQLEQTLRDFSDLLRSSKLSRTANRQTCDFPFLLRLNEHCLQKQIEIDRNARIVNQEGKKISLYTIAGINAAMIAMGIQEREAFLQNVIRSSLFKEKEKVIKLTVKSLLQTLAKEASKLPENRQKGAAKLYLNGSFAFEAQECNPLLQVWENAIAGMAEADEEGMIRSAIVNTIMHVVKSKVHRLVEDDAAARKKISRTLRQELGERIHLQYDPQVAGADLSDDQHSTGGAFILYDKNHTGNPHCWLRIDNPKDFQTFVFRILEENKKKLNYELSKEEWCGVEQTYKKLDDYIDSSDFLSDCLKEYYPPNGSFPNLLKNYLNIHFAPWVTKSGNNLNKVLQVYFQNQKIGPVHQFTPSNGEELLYNLVHFARGLSKPIVKKLQDNPDFLLPARVTGLHAFSLMFGHPTLFPIWQDNGPIETWIEKKIALCKQIAQSTIDPDIQQQLIQFAQENLVHEEYKKQFLNQVKKIPSTSLVEFREQLLRVILKLESAHVQTSSRTALLLDTCLYRVLPKGQKELLQQQHIHFSDTNWAEGVNDIHFCLMVNPGTGKLELWGSRDDDSQCFAMDQRIWFENKVWEIFSPTRETGRTVSVE